jgi:hypothetical protein
MKREAIRTLRKNPALSVGIVIALALGIGATVAISSVRNGWFSKPLSHEEEPGTIPVGSGPTSWYVRKNGGTATQCTGLADADYPGSGTRRACAYSNISAAIKVASCGDSINVNAGDIFDVSSPITLENKNCTSTPITIRSTAYAALPDGRIGPNDKAKMPAIRATGTNGAFADVSGGSYWKLDGLEITDNATSVILFLLDLRHGGKTDVVRVYGHPKETNPTWPRAAFRFAWYEGSAGLSIEKSHLSGFLGYAPGTTSLQTSEVLLSIGGKNVTLTNNFLSAWYATIFTGGGNSSTPTQTATFSGTPSKSSMTFSNTTGLHPGQIIRIDWSGTASIRGGVFTRTGGAALTNSDVVGGGGSGVGVEIVGSGYVLQLSGISDNVWTFNSGNPLSNGTYNWKMFQAVRVDSVSGSTVNFTPFGATPLTRNLETSNCAASWITDGIGDNAAHWVIQQNTFWIDPEFAVYQAQNGGQLPKGIWEMKHMVDLLVNGNRFTGFPSGLFFASYSNDGTTPWSTVQDITISNNFFDFELYPKGAGTPLDFSISDPYHSNTPGKNIFVFNNLVKNQQGFIKGKSGSNIQVYHNTVLNNVAGFSYNAVLAWGADNATDGTGNWVFRDNIVAYQGNGAMCFNRGGKLSDCWPSGKWSKNVVVDIQNTGVTSATWGPGSILTPVQTSFSDVGFTNEAAGNYRLLNSSRYRRQGTGGEDPGINQDALEAALPPTTLAATRPRTVTTP